MKKRFLSFLLATILPFSFVACGGRTGADNSNTNGDTSNNGTNEGGTNEGGSNEGGSNEENATPIYGDTLKIMSYNMQTGDETSIKERAPKVLATVTTFDADVVGTQEINAYWIAEMEANGFLDAYTMVGEPRDHADSHVASNEYSAIFYKTELFNLIDSGTYWLSDTPTEISRLESCDYNRIMTYAVLERKSDGFKFLHVNTHLEWAHADVDTNLLQTEIMLYLTDDALYENGDMPVYFTGDFNASNDSDGFAAMIDWGAWDTREEATVSSDAPTWPGGPSYIDFCFVSDGDFAVDKFDVGTECEGSDHNPLFIEMRPILKK